MEARLPGLIANTNLEFTGTINLKERLVSRPVGSQTRDMDEAAHSIDDELYKECEERLPLTGIVQPPSSLNRIRRLWKRVRPHWKRFTPFAILVLTALGFTFWLFYEPYSPPTSDPYHRLACSNYPDDCRVTAPFIFASVEGLLKQWPNNYASNGHSIITATVPPNTQIYHTRPDGAPPKNPTFFAFDAEMSLGIYGGSGTPRIYTMVTKKPLNVLYFDGQSATLSPWGTIDAQMALLENDVAPDFEYNLVYNEDARGAKLCALAKELGIDGFVRMNAGFELLVCDRSASGVVESFSSDVTVPGNREREEDPSIPRDPNRVPPLGFGNEFAPQNSFEWIRSGTWQYTGEKRVSLDLCFMVTYYDPYLRSLSGQHHSGVRGNDRYQNGWGLRRGHRLVGISKEDIASVKKWLKEATKAHASKNKLCSGVNWQALIETVLKQHQTRGRELLLTIKNAEQSEAGRAAAITKVHELTHAILYPYLQYPSIVQSTVAVQKEATISKCSTAYTRHIATDSLNDFELLLKQSIDIVIEELCSLEWSLFEWSDRHTSNLLHNFTRGARSEGDRIRDVRTEFKGFEIQTQKIFDWLGWNDWHGCEPECAWNKVCYTPMWPVVYAPGKHQGGYYGDDSYTEEEMKEFWTPKCINRTMFDKGGGRGREPAFQFPDVPQYPVI